MLSFQSDDGYADVPAVSVSVDCDASDVVEVAAATSVDPAESRWLPSPKVDEEAVGISPKLGSIKLPCCITTDLGIEGGVSWMLSELILEETDRGGSARPGSIFNEVALVFREMTGGWDVGKPAVDPYLR